MAIGRGDLMTFNRLITTLLQLFMAAPIWFAIYFKLKDRKAKR